MAIRNIIWDFDGTIVDTYPVIAKTFVEACRREFSNNLDYDDVYALSKVSLTMCYEELASRFEVTADAVRRAFLSYYHTRTVGVDEPLFSGVNETLRYIGSIGGTNLLVTHREAPSLEEYGDIGGCRRLITDILSGDSGFPMKPDPAAFTHLISKYRLRKSETIGVGDRALDVEAARNAGIHSCYFDPEGLRLASADFRFQDYTELLSWLRSRDRSC